MADESTPLSDEERAELEALRAAKRANEEAAQRAELEALRRDQAQAEEDAAYYAEREARKARRAYEREHPDYSVDDLPPMPLKQKIVLAVAVLLVVALVFYLIWCNAFN